MEGTLGMRGRRRESECGSSASSGRRALRLAPVCVLALLASLVVAGCGAPAAVTPPVAGTPAATNGSGATSATTTGATSATSATGASHVTVYVEPDAGATPLTQAIASAQRSVWVEVYLLTDSAVIHALEDAANRGVDVRVLLELHPYGSGSTSAALTLEELQAAGVKAEGSNPAFHYTHEKAMIVDGATLWVMTANLTKSGLGGSSAAVNREYLVVDTAAPDVAEASAIFVADWQRTRPTLGDATLVVSPVNARGDLAALIGAARSRLIVEDEEMYDSQSEDALIAAAQRGVNVEVVLPQPSGGTDGDVQRLVSGGVHVRYIATLYMHAKMIVADGQQAFVGSENFSANSLDDNRELGLLISDPTAIATLTATFATDWATSQNAG